MSAVEIRNFVDCYGDRIEGWYKTQEEKVRTAFRTALDMLKTSKENWESRCGYFKNLDNRHECNGLGEIRFSVAEGERMFRALGYFTDSKKRETFIIIFVGEKKPVMQADLEDDPQPTLDEKGNQFYVENCKPVQRVRWKILHGSEKHYSRISRISGPPV